MFRIILETLRDKIFVEELDVEYNKLFFASIRYALSEEKLNDWIFKTSFLSVNHKLRSMDQFNT